jgi:CheY-like chemotaxis protein
MRQGGNPVTKILVVEDEPLELETIAMILELETYETVGAEDGIQGLERAQSEKPDLIVTGNWMPRMNGDEMVKRLRQMPETATIPIIFLLHPAHNDRLDEILSLGVDECLFKPVDPEELLECVQLVLRA